MVYPCRGIWRQTISLSRHILEPIPQTRAHWDIRLDNLAHDHLDDRALGERGWFIKNNNTILHMTLERHGRAPGFLPANPLADIIVQKSSFDEWEPACDGNRFSRDRPQTGTLFVR
jgi:hypothetical protein